MTVNLSLKMYVLLRASWTRWKNRSLLLGIYWVSVWCWWFLLVFNWAIRIYKYDYLIIFFIYIFFVYNWFKILITCRWDIRITKTVWVLNSQARRWALINKSPSKSKLSLLKLLEKREHCRETGRLSALYSHSSFQPVYKNV